ncbi:hypothetical protein [Hymenobacter psychrophilus]|uniref:Uncharacterized protein n=1 Tax=Hymenobacter psychrophilus TaxID=651662 RepID=A0A1H3NPZ0_9BACT|nr:hypothetical protein [Hymenobacter psychrophilus]SDY90986.1 hypothetical protein SAMN04488069_11835 [Hymenobacter psychrophilus]
MRHDSATVLLYRPVGQAELDWIAASDWLELPLQGLEPRVFYLTQPTAEPMGSGADYLLRLTVDADYAAHFEVVATDRQPEQLRVPAAELAGFNHQLVGRIEVVGLLPPG